jgi:hypothetical protein
MGAHFDDEAQEFPDLLAGAPAHTETAEPEATGLDSRRWQIAGLVHIEIRPRTGSGKRSTSRSVPENAEFS